MKQEIKDVVTELSLRTVPAGGGAWYADMNLVTVLTCVFVVLQILYLLRKWWREETEVGVRLKAWAERTGLTKPGDLQ